MFNKYRYLRESKDETPSALQDNLLSKNERGELQYVDPRTNKSWFLVGCEMSTYFEYYVFPNHKAFLKYLESLKEDTRNFHEVIIGEVPQKIKIDIDCETEAQDNSLRKHLETFICNIESATAKVFSREYNANLSADNFLRFDSSGKSPNGYKYSFHLIVDGFYVANHLEAKYITRLILEQLSDNPLAKYIDTGVNKHNQNFRIVNNCKLGQPNRFKRHVNHQWERQKISFKRTLVQSTEGCQGLPELVIPQDSPGDIAPGNAQVNLAKGDLNEIAKISRKYTGGCVHKETFAYGKGYILVFSRVESSYCHLCERAHDNDNCYLYVVIFEGICSVYFKCRRADATSVGSALFAGDFVATSADSFETSRETAEEEAPSETEREDIAGGNLLRYKSAKVREFELCDTLCVRAPMKMGKTKRMIEFIRNNFADEGMNLPRVIILSFRHTFSNEIKANLPEFHLYNEIEGSIKHRKVIIQVESLHRLIVGSRQVPDLLVLDESESILEQFGSGLMKYPNNVWNVFEWLLTYSKHVLAMDALLSNRTLQVLHKMRIEGHPERSIRLHHNTYKNAKKDTYWTTIEKPKWYASLFADLDDGLKVAVAMSSLKEAEVLYKLLEKRVDLRVGFYSSKTLNSIKREHFANVGTYWKNYDVLIYTPTVSAGVSFEETWYDKIYGWFSRTSCPVETCIQMLGRVRNVSKREYVIGFDLAGDFALPTTIDGIKNSLRATRESLYKNYDDDMLDFSLNLQGEVEIKDTKYNVLWLWNAVIKNKSRQNFVGRFQQHLESFGANLNVLQEVYCDEEELKNLRKDSNIAKREIEAIHARLISEAPEITAQEAEEIRARRELDDVFEEEKASVEKRALRNFYGWNHRITPDFVMRYGVPKVKRWFHNLRKIAKYPTFEEALKTIQTEERLLFEEYQKNGMTNTEIGFNYEFEKHFIAIFFLRTLGTDNIQKPKAISQSAFSQAITSVREQMVNSLRDLPRVYGIKGPTQNQLEEDDSFDKTCLKYMKKVLLMMYGLRVVSKNGIHNVAGVKMFSFSRNLVNNNEVPNIFSKFRDDLIQEEESVREKPPERDDDPLKDV